MAAKRRRVDSWERQLTQDEAHVLAYAAQQIRTPLTSLDVGSQAMPACAPGVQRAITAIAQRSVADTMALRDKFLANVRCRDQQMRRTGVVDRWNKSADAATVQIRGGANGPLMLELLAEAGEDTRPLAAILTTGDLHPRHLIRGFPPSPLPVVRAWLTGADLMHDVGVQNAQGMTTCCLRSGCREHNVALRQRLRELSSSSEQLLVGQEASAELHRQPCEDAKLGRVAWPKPFGEALEAVVADRPQVTPT